MYEKHFGLSEKPFSIVPNPRFLYFTAKHQNALTHLEYGLMERVGFVLLTGEIGIGKTTLIRHLLNQVEKNMEIAVIFNTNVTADHLLSLIMQEFNLPPVGDNKATKIEALYKFFIDRFAAGNRVLLVIDEAQNLSEESLEEVRMLSNLHSDDQLLLQIMLVGQPELKHKLAHPALRQLAQRIAVNYHLTAMTGEETALYIAARLQIAGANREIFTPEAIARIHDCANGTPRIVNLLCDAALVYGFADDLKVIDHLVVEQVIKDKGGLGLGMQPLVGEEKGEGALLAAGGAPALADPAIALRLTNLEQTVQQLQLQVNLQQELLRQTPAPGISDQIHLLESQLAKERQRYDDLLRAYDELKEAYQKAHQEEFSPDATLIASQAQAVEPTLGTQLSDPKPARSWFRWFQ